MHVQFVFFHVCKQLHTFSKFMAVLYRCTVYAVCAFNLSRQTVEINIYIWYIYQNLNCDFLLYLVKLPLVLYGSHVASYGQLLRQLLILGCQPLYDLLQRELKLPAVVGEGL